MGIGYNKNLKHLGFNYYNSADFHIIYTHTLFSHALHRGNPFFLMNRLARPQTVQKKLMCTIFGNTTHYNAQKQNLRLTRLVLVPGQPEPAGACRVGSILQHSSSIIGILTSAGGGIHHKRHQQAHALLLAPKMRLGTKIAQKWHHRARKVRLVSFKQETAEDAT